MANFFLKKTPDYKKIFLYIDDVSVNSNFPVLNHYLENNKYKTYTVNNDIYEIRNVEYTPSSDVDELNFVNTTTSFGDYMVFEINTNVIGLTENEIKELESGIHVFQLISIDSEVNFISSGLHIDNDISCCIAKKIDKSLTNNNCDLNQSLEDVKKIFAINQSIDASLKEEEYENAKNKRVLAKNICNSNCNCGC